VLTKVDDIIHFASTVLCDAGEHCPIRTRRYACYGDEVGVVVLDKLDAALHLFPEFQVAVDGGRDDEIGPRAAR
jgi:hypothetical protein